MTKSDEIVQQRKLQWQHNTDRKNVARIQRLASESNLSFMEASAAIHSTDMEHLCDSIDNITMYESENMTLTNFDYYMDILVDKLNG